MRRGLLWVPLAAFVVLIGVVAWGLLRPADRTIHSAMVGKPLPRFALRPMLPGRPGVGDTGRGARLVNIFGSWCIPCAAEAPQLTRLKAMGVPIDGIAIRDTPDAVRGFLARYGDPYRGIGDDPASGVQLALGSSGVPETFLIDAHGVIVAQHIGDIRADEVDGLYAQWKGLANAAR
jgi:cytochrome c biogenesis protein CcmG/thiol:disulfide interchange protein DsbE